MQNVSEQDLKDISDIVENSSDVERTLDELVSQTSTLTKDLIPGLDDDNAFDGITPDGKPPQLTGLSYDLGVDRKAFNTQFDALRSKVNRFLEEKNGKKKTQKTVAHPERHRIPSYRSFRNGFGVLWLFGMPRYEEVTKYVPKTIEETVDRTLDEGVVELYRIVDSYTLTYKKYADYLAQKCRGELVKALRRITKTKSEYFNEAITDKNEAVKAQKKRAECVEEFNRKKEAFAKSDPNTKAHATLEAELDLLNLKIAKYTNDSIVFTRQAVGKRHHSVMLKFAEYGMYLILQTAHTNVQAVREYVRQLEHIRMFSAISTQTLHELGILDQKINEGVPYIRQSNDLVVQILGLAFTNYNGLDQSQTHDPGQIIDGIRQFHDKSQIQYAATMKALEQIKRPHTYVGSEGARDEPAK